MAAAQYEEGASLAKVAAAFGVHERTLVANRPAVPAESLERLGAFAARLSRGEPPTS